MVSAGQHLNPILEQALSEARRNPKSRGGVLPVRNHQVNLALLDQVSQPVMDDLPPRRPHNVPYEKNAHEVSYQSSVPGLPFRKRKRAAPQKPTPIVQFAILY